MANNPTKISQYMKVAFNRNFYPEMKFRADESQITIAFVGHTEQ